eukprot:1350073-Amorphochlora_amoeboformis.AAC.1
MLATYCGNSRNLLRTRSIGILLLIGMVLFLRKAVSVQQGAAKVALSVSRDELRAIIRGQRAVLAPLTRGGEF